MRLKVKMKTSIVQANRRFPLSIPWRKSKFVSVMTGGKIMKVTRKTAARLVKNFQARKKLFFIMIKKVTRGE
jgi:hypothetical protein